MDYSYVAYTEDERLIKGKVSATDEEAATNLLSYGGFKVVSLKQVVPFFNMGKLSSYFSRIKPMEIVMFSRQLALLLESGTDIVTSLELLQNQVTNQALKEVIGYIAADIRGGSSLSSALRKHPKAFSEMYHRAISAGEQAGNLEVVLRQMADDIQRRATTGKKVQNALTYPFIVSAVAVLVIVLLITFVLPRFTELYASFDVELPLLTRLLVGLGEWSGQYGLWLVLGLAAIIVTGVVYIRTPAGKYQWHKLSLNIPILGRINLLTELSNSCRTIALLFKVGLPLPEIMAMTTYGTTNKVMSEALTGVQEELLRGEGLSKPMAKRKLFLPLMVQMVGVGEETGNLDNTLATVAQSYELEAEDRTNSAVGLIQPALTIIIGLVIGLVVIALMSALYSVYGQLNL
jgi:type IV pilus assembly protein PilC